MVKQSLCWIAFDGTDAEKAALYDPFLSDAMEGIKNHVQKNNADDFDNDVKELKKRLAEKITEEKKVIPLSRSSMWQRIFVQ